MSLGRKILLSVVAVVVVLVVAAGIFIATFDANQYRGVVLERLSGSLNRPVEASELKLQIFPLRLRLEQVRVKEDPVFANDDFLRAAAVQFDVNLGALLSGDVQVTANSAGTGDSASGSGKVETANAVSWAEVFWVENVGIYDSFFDIGGHSLLATKIVSRAKDTFKVDLAVKALFSMVTIRDMSMYIDTLIRTRDDLFSGKNKDGDNRQEIEL